MQILWGILGIIVILGIAFLFSNNKKAINFRTILLALVIQILFALIVLKWPLGHQALKWVSDKVEKVVGTAGSGIDFLFGPVLPEDGSIFAFQVLPVIIFFSSLISVLYYLGVMQWMIRLLGGALQKLLKTSKVESMNAAGNIFLGQTEAPLVVKPYIKNMTNSEMFAVMTGGLSTVAGSVLAGYALLGVPMQYLIAASFMAAPAGLLMAKLIIPESHKEETTDDVTLEKDTETTNVIDAAARGASDGLKLALTVGAMLIAFISLIALINLLLDWVGGWVGLDITLQQILGYIFSPIAFLIGVPWDEAIRAGSLIGQKIVLNEFVAFSNFGPNIAEYTEKTKTIISFALCGFANVGSMAILIGGLSPMAPNRRGDIARLGVKAIIAGTLANLLSAAIAGMLV
ncbi:NupC/NupG family nucleoside CNT transporter [Tuberibacillus sp. Marseille-P3662]|uniref:NupC/NupG family nucleoside CNT transporter n=1 Tax=Tuberibacillus sp. Marseille-P3662 TaxID=1965358 RepID=UPI000A1CC94E|nr:NupC/NupG family nucleoside CNT transporter [Tuberibacillus sp. Marseille-P3662]